LLSFAFFKVAFILTQESTSPRAPELVQLALSVGFAPRMAHTRNKLGRSFAKLKQL